MSETPILDLEQDPPKSAALGKTKLIGVVIGLAIATAFILADQNKSPAWHWPRFNGLLLIPALYVAIAVHEVGHWAAGALVGMDSGGISVGAFVLAKSGKTCALSLTWKTA